MCTAIVIYDKNILFGRNMDLDYDLKQKAIYLPKGYEIDFKKENSINTDYRMLGIGVIKDNYPLLADAINEKGVGFAGLAFKDNCKYYEFNLHKKNYAPYEFVLYILGKCKSIEEIRSFLNNLNIVDIPFSKDIFNTPLHFIFVDKTKSIVVETTSFGMKIYDNFFNVLTNNPEFSYHKENVKNYINLNNSLPINHLLKGLDIKPFSYNQAALGLPGDFSSASRFIKVLYVKNNLVLDGSSNDILEFFKCLGSVSMIKGSVKTENGFETTRYTSCYDLKAFKLYYKSYYAEKISSIDPKDFKDQVKTIDM